jgi:1-acyl-sn-glycerol-3-phosphate acyltransferase
MLVVRSLIFNVAFYVNIILWMIGILPTLLLPRRTFMRVVRAWARSSLWLLKVLAGTRVEFQGVENIPRGGLMVASKHQSLWETFALMTLFEDPTFVLKRELMRIPVFGWYLRKAGCISVDRTAGSRALVKMNQDARREMAEGRQLLIFPEGTRRQPGAPAAYKYGVAYLYRNLGVPCLTVGLNSGLYWPRRRFVRHPGTIRVELMPPILPGLPREEAFKLIRDRIETSSNRLLAEGLQELKHGGSQKP